MESAKCYAAIDLKSFYASVECIERGLDPLNTHLVVADPSRTEKTICLAVSPSLKALGVPGRPRLFEVVQILQNVNALRRDRAPGRQYTGTSFDAPTLERHRELGIDYIVAPPQMALYMTYSAQVYQVYLKHVAPEDIHVYSIDEVFIDMTPYLPTLGIDAQTFAARILRDVFETTGLTATCGIGTNLYLCKVAMDIVAKHSQPDKNGMRIASLDETTYRSLLWDHEPITDFWRVGKGYAQRLNQLGIRTMGDIARCSLAGDQSCRNEDTLYRHFGVNAELLIDHAWGWEPTTISDIKAYRPASHSVSSGQVLQCPYPYEKACLVIREMADQLALDLVEKGLVTDQLVLTVSYDVENLTDPLRRQFYTGPIVTDHYGRQVPKHGHGSYTMSRHNASTTMILQAVHSLCQQVMDPDLLVRKINLTANRVLWEKDLPREEYQQLDLFDDPQSQAQRMRMEATLERERRRQKAVLAIRRKYGKNAILKAMNLEEGATARERNGQVGGHKA